jgi:hypothetical protein
MGAANSVPQAIYADSPENDKAKMFSTIFLRLLQETDIVDINALTRGPGACGSYAVILEKELKKEFKTIKLQTTSSGLKDVRDFLYSKAKNIESESPTDANACRELAIFYIRLLQLVSALTLSIYTPADLIDRIRNNASITALKKQEKNIPLTIEDEARKRAAREAWFYKHIVSEVSGSTNFFYLQKDKKNFKYNRDTKMLIYTADNGYKYEASLRIEEVGAYNVDRKYSKPDTYWIVLYSSKLNKNIYRILVTVTETREGRVRSGYLFSPEVDSRMPEEVPIVYYQDWTQDLAAAMTGAITGERGEERRVEERREYNRSRNGRNGRNGRNPLVISRDTALQLREAGINVDRNLTRPVDVRGGGATLLVPRSKNAFGYQNTRSNSASVTVSREGSNRNTRKNRNRQNVVEKSSLPKQFQEIYNFMVQWNLQKDAWTEAAPATYRSILLYIKPGLANLEATSFFCVDNWAQKSMRYIPPFAALEALYFNENDGSASVANQTALKLLAQEFNKIYYQSVTSEPTTLANVIVPALEKDLSALVCVNKTSQGDISVVSEKNKAILEAAQDTIMRNHKSYFNEAYATLMSIFEVKRDAKGDIAINFTEQFATSSGGVRAKLEQIIYNTRQIIARHYIATETTYIGALRQLELPKAVQPSV